jgi:hypothetical protein
MPAGRFKQTSSKIQYFVSSGELEANGQERLLLTYNQSEDR